MQLEDLIKEICKKWELVLHPKADRYKWDAALKTEFSGYSFYNGSDLQNYGKCNSYDIIAHKNVPYPELSNVADIQSLRSLGGHRNELFLELSTILPFYLVTALRKTLNPDGAISVIEITPDTAELVELHQRAKQFAERNGFTELPQAWKYKVIPDVELENAERGFVTIYNCLFEDWDLSHLAETELLTR